MSRLRIRPAVVDGGAEERAQVGRLGVQRRSGVDPAQPRVDQRLIDRLGELGEASLQHLRRALRIRAHAQQLRSGAGSLQRAADLVRDEGEMLPRLPPQLERLEIGELADRLGCPAVEQAREPSVLIRAEGPRFRLTAFVDDRLEEQAVFANHIVDVALQELPLGPVRLRDVRAELRQRLLALQSLHHLFEEGEQAVEDLLLVQHVLGGKLAAHAGEPTPADGVAVAGEKLRERLHRPPG